MKDSNPHDLTQDYQGNPSPNDEGAFVEHTERIGRYRIEKVLGSGGFGLVYLAHDEQLNRAVAIKVPHTRRISKPEDAEAYLAEARTVASLDHPGIVPVLDVGGTEDCPCYIVSKYIQGTDLATKLKEHRLNYQDASELVAAVADALQYAHKQGLVHRDVKPGNILIGDDGKPYVVDFGLALKDENLGKGPQYAGTPAYMSPEQARGEGHRVDGRCDIFSLGVVFYELLTGRPPFWGDTPTELLEQITTREPRPLLQYDERLPKELERICFKAMSKSVSERYSSAHEMAEELRQFLREQTMTPGGTLSGRINSPASSTKRRNLAIALGIVAALAAGLLLFLKFGAQHKSADTATNAPPPVSGAPSAVDQKSIAVLPFLSMSADKADEYLSDGMTEELLNVLAKVPGLHVPGRSSCFAFKGKTEDDIFRKVGQQLHVATVLEGSVRKAGDKLRITAQLINVADGFHIWSETYDGDVKDILSFQRSVAQRVVQELQVKLGVEASRELARTETVNPEAHRLYLLGRHYFFKGTEENHKKAIEYFNQALQQDPNYARAYCGLADAVGDWESSPKDYVPKMRAYAETALKLDPLLAEAHVSMAVIRFYFDFDFAGAEKEYQQALKLNPNLALAHDQYAAFLASLERFTEALAEQKKAVDLDPLLAWMTTDLSYIYYLARDYNKAIELAKQGMELDASFPGNYFALGWPLLMQGKPGEAIPQFEKILKVSDYPWTRSNLGCAYAVAGDRAKAEAVLKGLDELETRQFVTPYCRAAIWALLNDKDRALELLERAVAERDYACVAMKTDPVLDSLRREPRFEALLKKMGFDK